ncbi:unnamed protein product [Candidula unifasciata]|uniref:Peroxin-19 n=1 Tax=Candidula unifasciata TaxID=100452 RepID=A0A8S3ZMQ0_9EUPU|nr:unnamed protein product [Candidula unifasciata]
MASKGDSGNLDEENRSSSVDNSSSALKTEAAKSVDAELEAILDSALEDFDKVKQTAKKCESGGEAVSHTVGNAGTDQKGSEPQNKTPFLPEDGLPEDASYDFLADAMSKQFEETFSALLNDPNLKRQFEELADSADQAASSNNAAAFADTVEKALSGLNLNAENLQGDPNQQELWEHLAESLGTDASGGLGGAEEGLGAMSGMFQSMVKQLLSKELLYQPLKEVSDKYKDYLEKNKSSLEAEKVTTYSKQLEIIEKVVVHLDGDSEQHSEEEKNARFEVLLDLLQRMHELGNPPTEVVGEGNMMMPNLGDFGNMGQFPGMGGLGSSQDPSQCAVM